jgi:hypothetical protein
LLEIVTRLQVQSGLLALVVNRSDRGTLIARIEDRQITVDASEPMIAVSAVHQLLNSAGFFIDSERAGL